MLFIGDYWALDHHDIDLDHHDIEIEDDTGRRLARSRLPEGVESIAKLDALIAEHAPAEWVDLPAEQIIVEIETDRGPLVVALQAARYLVFAINPLSAAGIGSAIPRPAPNPMQAMRTYWPRLSASIGPITARSLGTVIWPTRSNY